MLMGLESGFILGSLVYDSCGLFSIRVGLCVSPPLSVFNTPISTSSLEFKATFLLLKGNRFSLSPCQGGVIRYHKKKLLYS